MHNQFNSLVARRSLSGLVVAGDLHLVVRVGSQAGQRGALLVGALDALLHEVAGVEDLVEDYETSDWRGVVCLILQNKHNTYSTNTNI